MSNSINVVFADFMAKEMPGADAETTRIVEKAFASGMVIGVSALLGEVNNPIEKASKTYIREGIIAGKISDKESTAMFQKLL